MGVSFSDPSVRVLCTDDHRSVHGHNADNSFAAANTLVTLSYVALMCRLSSVFAVLVAAVYYITVRQPANGHIA